MSRVAKNPVIVPSGVEVALAANEISVKGPLGSLTQSFAGDVSVVREGDSLLMEESENGTDVSGQWEGRQEGGEVRGIWQSADGAISKQFVLRPVDAGHAAATRPTPR